MRRISIAVVLSVLCFVSMTSAQQTAAVLQPTSSSAAEPPGRTQLSGGPDTVTTCVGVKKGAIPIWNRSSPYMSLCNSGIYEASPYGTGAIGILNPNPIAALDVTGATNTSLYYQIGGSTVVSIGNPSEGNLFLGVGAGSSNSSGNGNTFSGVEAGNANTTGDGNTFIGSDAGSMNATGQQNTFAGSFAGSNNITGSGNIFLGIGAGIENVSGNNDIYIGLTGGSSNSESNTIRIGNYTQTATYMTGIYGSISSSGLAVYIASDGHLGTQTSSLRFKEQVRDMGDSTSALMKLRPVTFLYKPQYDAGERTLQYGLIAEEVAKVYPALVANDRAGQPYAVRYQYLSTMLLNEVQKQYRRAEAEANVITAQEQKLDEQQQRIEEMQRRLARLESLLDTKGKTTQENAPSAGSAGAGQ